MSAWLRPGTKGWQCATCAIVQFLPLCAHARCPTCSEGDIEALAPRAGSPAWLVEEVDALKAGLLDLRHNVVLLRSPDSDSEFTPVRAPPYCPPKPYPES